MQGWIPQVRLSTHPDGPVAMNQVRSSLVPTLEHGLYLEAGCLGPSDPVAWAGVQAGHGRTDLSHLLRSASRIHADDRAAGTSGGIIPVSYTHLTLPTK